MTKRKAISLRTKLAAALLQTLRVDETGALVPVIPHDQAKTMTEDQIISAFELDHYPKPVALGGDNHPSNLTFLPRADHRKKTAKQDIPAIAKVKRLSRNEAEFRARLLAKDVGEDPPQKRGKRSIPSRKFQSRRKAS